MKALVVYEIHGAFPPAPPAASISAYRLEPAMQAIVEVAKIDRADELAARRAGVAWQWFAGDHPALAARVAAAPQAMIVRAELDRPADTAYLRHAVGLAQLLLDAGGLAVHDVQTLRWYPADAWRAEVFADASRPHAHVVVLTSVVPERGAVWIHTRGLRKLGRPDLSLHAPAARQDEAIARVQREIVAPSAGDAAIAGDPDDPDFNNVHVELDLPGD